MSRCGRAKAILAGKLEAYDVVADPAEAHDLGSGADLPGNVRRALEDYPVPSAEAARAPDTLSDDARRSLASLGYVGASSAPVVRRDAPRPPTWSVCSRARQGSGLFVEERMPSHPLLRDPG